MSASPQNRPGQSRRYIVDMRLSADQVRAFYAGDVSQVSVRDRHGLRLVFPLQSLRGFVDHDGVRGTFALYVDAGNRLQKLERL